MADESIVGTPPQETPTPETPAATPPVEAPAAPATPEPTAVTPPEPAAQPAQPPQEPVTPPPVEPPSDTPPERVVPAADGYTLQEGMPAELGEFANKNGFTQEQLDVTVQKFGGYFQGMKNAEQAALKSLGEAHLKNWGGEAPHNLTLAKRALAQNDPSGSLAQALNESGYGNHPAVLDFLYNLGKGMKEGGFLKGNVNKPPGEKTMAQKMFPNMTSTEG